MRQKKLISFLMLVTGLVPAVHANRVELELPELPTSQEVLANPDFLQGASKTQPVVATPEYNLKASDTLGKNVLFALHNPLRSEPRDSDDEAWLVRAWQMWQDWGQVVGVAETRQIRAFSHSYFLAIVDAEEIGLPLEGEVENQPQEETPAIDESILLRIPNSVTSFGLRTATVLTLCLGLLGFKQLHPQHVPGKHHGPAPSQAALKRQLVPLKREKRYHPRFRLRW